MLSFPAGAVTVSRSGLAKIDLGRNGGGNSPKNRTLLLRARCDRYRARMPYLSKFLIAVISLASTQHAFADSLYQFSSVNQTFTDNPVTLGFVFEVNSPF